MAHQTTQRRILASPDPPTPMDPTAAKTHHRRRHQPPPIIHPQPDPTITSPSTIQNISQRFSRLYYNHKKLVSRPHPHPQPEPHFQEKKPTFLDTSCTTLTKSSSVKHSAMVEKVVEKNHFLRSKVKEKDATFKKPSFEKLDPKRPSFEECDVKKVSQLMFKSFDSEGVKKGSQEGSEVKGRNSVSSVPSSMVNVGRRSFCNSQVELADFFSCTGVKVVAVDMPPFMQIHAVDCARKAHDSLEKFTSKTLAFTLKKEFDGAYGPAWHCIVGTSFGSFVTHSVGGFMYFSMDNKIYILLFKTTVQRAE